MTCTSSKKSIWYGVKMCILIHFYEAFLLSKNIDIQRFWFVITMPADDLAPNGVRPSTGTVLINDKLSLPYERVSHIRATLIYLPPWLCQSGVLGVECGLMRLSQLLITEAKEVCIRCTHPRRRYNITFCCVWMGVDHRVTEILKSCHNTNFDDAGGIGGCHDDNVWCCMSQLSWHYDNSGV